METLEALEAKWRAATADSEQKVAAWDFAGALGMLESVWFDDEQLAARLARRKDELRRMAALKDRMIARINTADPPLKKADLMLRGVGGEVSGADQEAITATLATGRNESLAWGDLGSQAPGRLLQLVVDPSDGDDWLSGGVFALGIGDAAFAAARELLDAGDFAKAADALTALETKYAGTPWWPPHQSAVVAAQSAAAQGLREAEAEALYTEAVAHFEKEQLFDVRPLVQRLKAEYVGTSAVTDTTREPSLAELEAAVADLGTMLTVRQDGKGDFESIQAAIDAAPPNSLIEIQDTGPYNEQITITKAGMTLRGKEGNWPIITSAGLPAAVHTSVAVSAPHVQIEHVVIVHTRAGGTYPRSLAVRASPCRLAKAVVFGPRGTSVDVAGILYLDYAVMATHANVQAAPLHVTNSLWLASSPAYLVRGGTFNNVLLLGVGPRHQIELHQCTIRDNVVLPEGSVASDSIVPSVRAAKNGVLIEFCNVHGRTLFIDHAKPGEGCFSAPPKFVDPKNLDDRLVPGSPGTGMASDGGDVGVRYTPEMIEILKLALELRARGIINF